ncbi:hypothetical protein G6F31_019599 [Rhizopus arrhizus]|nr:hypothetical protein G6F31_019599 [Rhizopus arrhizus]
MRQVAAAPPDQHHFPSGAGVAQGYAAHACGQGVTRLEPRKEGHAQSGGYQRHDEIDLAASGRDGRGKARALAGVMEDAVKGEAGLEQDERRLAQIGQSHRLGMRERAAIPRCRARVAATPPARFRLPSPFPPVGGCRAPPG